MSLNTRKKKKSGRGIFPLNKKPRPRLYKPALEFSNSQFLGLTFNDVLLFPSHSDVHPNQVDLKTRFSRNIPLLVPIVSAPMDTVTEYEMAVALPKQGGIGILHRNLEPLEQQRQAGRVKRNLSGRIQDPRCVFEDEIIQDILNRQKDENLDFNSFPVLTRSGKLTGLLTGRHFYFCRNPSTTVVRDTMVPFNKLTTADPETDLRQAYDIMMDNGKKALPLIDPERNLKGMYVWKDVEGRLTGKWDLYNRDEKGRLRVGAAIGVGEQALERLDLLTKPGIEVDVVVIDTAHADTRDVHEALRNVKETLKHAKSGYDLDVVVGNIGSPDAVKELIRLGADGIKVGIGPGSICSTREISGVGVPQVTAIYKCAQKVMSYTQEVTICADGGIVSSGDITKAIAAGAYCVMMGGLLARTIEAPGEMITLGGRTFKKYRGMGSLGAMASNEGSAERYFQSSSGKMVPEGVEGVVPLRGSLDELIFLYLGGLRSGMGYTGSRTIEDLRLNANFIRQTPSGRIESRPHDITITEEAPNLPTEGGGNHGFS